VRERASEGIFMGFIEAITGIRERLFPAPNLSLNS
jgi:hypothetical protein